MRLAAWLACGAFITLACGSHLGEPTSESSLAIVGGEASGADQDSVVLLRSLVDDVEFLCSGTLVAPNLVLTARHCVSYISDGLFSCSVQGELLERDPGAGRLGRHLPAEGFEVYGQEAPRKEPLARGQQVLSTLSSTICTNDLAFLVLDRELDLPLSPLRLDGPAKVGEPSTLVGYGLAALEESLDFTRAPRRQRPDAAIVGVGPDSVDDVTSVPPRAVILDGPSGCTGDSGGPLLAIETGAVLGVYSLMKGEDCAARGVSHQLVHVPAFSGLVEQAFAAAGYEPLRERMPGAGGGPTEGGAAASSGGASSDGQAGSSEAPNHGGQSGAPASEPPRKRDDAPSSSCAFGGSSMPTQASLVLAALLGASALRCRQRQRRPSSGSA